jgi:hypothetical protein
VVGLNSWFALRGLARLSPESRRLFNPIISRAFQMAWLGSLVLALVNASGLFSAPQGGVYFFVVLTPLALGAVSFTRIVFVRPEGGD